ncbi:MAG TPA: glycoside hydrolase family 36 protein [Abditibacteriaceae bacterium]|jgi:hypothetical protein
MNSISWQVHADGSFALQTPHLKIENCYPAFDGASLRALSVQVSQQNNAHHIEYSTVHGTFKLQLGVEENRAVLRSSLEGSTQTPRWIAPLVGRVLEAKRFFHQGLGFAGPSGFAEIGEEPFSAVVRTEGGSAPTWFVESYTVAALCAKSGESIAIGALDHRNVLQKTTLRAIQQRRGLINRHLESETLQLETAFATEEIAFGNELVLPDLYFVFFPNAWTGLQALAHDIGREMQTRTHQEPRYHWCSWYQRGCNFNARDLQDTLDGLRDNSSARVNTPLQTIQIDDGYCASPGDWLIPNALWPGGLPDAFARVTKAGFHAGVWIAPFAVGNRSRLFAEHPDWVLRDKSGAPVAEWQNYDGSGIPSHIDEETYVLDTTNPAAFEYLREVFRTLRGWGATFFKTDFMDWGLRDATQYARHTNSETSVQNYRRVLGMIREEIGEESFWLACIAPFAPFLGFADGVRVSNDTSHHWTRGSTINMFEQVTNCQFFNNVWWQNDPDVIFLRDKFLQLSQTEIESAALFTGISGGSVNTSDALHEIPESRLKLWRFVQPDFALQGENRNARFPYWNDKSRKLLVVVREYSDGDFGLLAVNLRDESVTEMVLLQESTPFVAPFVFDWNQNGSEPLGEKAELVVELAPHASRLFYISAHNNSPAPNLTVGGATFSMTGLESK